MKSYESKSIKAAYLKIRKESLPVCFKIINNKLTLENKIKTTQLRTNAKKNEENILQFIGAKGQTYRNEIARELKLNTHTVRDTLKRLIKNRKIIQLFTDKFQRRFYTLKCSRNSRHH